MTKQLVFKPIDNYTVALLLNGEEQGEFSHTEIADVIRNVASAYPGEAELQIKAAGGWTACQSAVRAAVEAAGIPSYRVGHAVASGKIEF